MPFEQSRLKINAAVELKDFTSVQTVIMEIIDDDPWLNKASLWNLALEHAIDIGCLSLVMEIDSLCEQSIDKDPWCVFRSAHMNHLALVQYFIPFKNEIYIWIEVARQAATNDNKPMMEYALDGIKAHYTISFGKDVNDEIYDILANRSGPIKRALSEGHVDMAKYLVQTLIQCLPVNSDVDATNFATMLPVFTYGRNVARSKNLTSMVKYLDDLMDTNPVATNVAATTANSGIFSGKDSLTSVEDGEPAKRAGLVL